MGGARAGSGLGSQSPLSDETALTRGGTRALVVGPCRWLPAGRSYGTEGKEPVLGGTAKDCAGVGDFCPGKLCPPDVPGLES